MGKKVNHQKRSKGKKDGAKELDVKSVPATINLHRRCHKASFKRKAPTAVKQVKDLAQKLMFTKDVRIDTGLN